MWFHKWSFKINENKSTHVTFTLRKQTCPQVIINNISIPNKDTVRVHTGNDSGQEINVETIHHRQIEATQGRTQKILLAHWPSLQPKHAEQNYAL